MRPSQFEAIRPHLQEAIDDIAADLERRQSLENDKELHDSFNRLAALPKGTPPKVKLQKLPPKEKKRALRSMLGPPPKNKRVMQAYRVMEKRLERSPPITSPDMACLYPWVASAREAVAWLRKGDWTTEADEIDLVLSRLPTGLVDGRHPENLDRHGDAIRAAAERVKCILTACLADSTLRTTKTKKGKRNDGGGAVAKKPRSTKMPGKRGRPAGPMPDTIQRANFARPLRECNKTWEQIATAYAKKYPKDIDASAATIRLACTPKRGRKGQPK